MNYKYADFYRKLKENSWDYRETQMNLLSEDLDKINPNLNILADQLIRKFNTKPKVGQIKKIAYSCSDRAKKNTGCEKCKDGFVYLFDPEKYDSDLSHEAKTEIAFLPKSLFSCSCSGNGIESYFRKMAEYEMADNDIFQKMYISLFDWINVSLNKTIIFTSFDPYQFWGVMDGIKLRKDEISESNMKLLLQCKNDDILVTF